MTSAEVRQSFLDFFREKQHTIVPSGSLLPDSPNLLFTNAGMNQFVPIFLGQQKPPWDPPRVVDTQKCIRAGGKHNDLDDVGLDTYHHTFFEMLGNWSFGDYFKKEAIDWAWELVIDRWKLPSQRLYATVYRPGPDEPSEFDQEAHDHWARLFTRAGLDPAVHVVDGNKKDNFWMMGDTGPCGPCSELHIDLTPTGDTKGSLVNAGDPRCIEIWNLVFIQFNANADGTFVPLPQRHVDTGMGFERITSMIQGTKQFTDFSRPISNYETDIFRPIFDEIEKLSGKKYGSTLPNSDRGAHAPSRAAVGASPTASGGAPDATPEAGVLPSTEQEKIDIAFRVIADHIRTLSFAIADGIQPSNEGRGYVLRRILRRAVRYGRTLGFREPFFFKLVDVLVRAMGDTFSELRVKQVQVQSVLRREEEAFNKTLDAGIELFNFYISALDVNNPTVTGRIAFTLYDTHGFPFDLTQLMARELGLAVDTEGFEMQMEEQRTRARAAQKKKVIELSEVESTEPTKFVGYEHDVVENARVLEVISLKDKTAVILNHTAAYAEMGGQVGDSGDLSEGGIMWRFVDTQRFGHTSLHLLDGDEGPAVGIFVTQRLDTSRRRAIERHHTVTHLLHWALHEIVSREAVQKGSYVGPEKLTFDFSSAALTPEQKREVGTLVNAKIGENAPVYYVPDVSLSDIKGRSDIQQFFGDKYGETVRVVQIGGDAEALNGYSMELCGGTHVQATGDIGSFRIVREEAIAAGIRRIEAVAGDAARDWAKGEAARQQERFEALARKKEGVAALTAFEDGVETNAMLEQVDLRSAHLEKLETEVREWEKLHAKTSEADLRSRAGIIANELAAANAGEKSCVAEVPDADGKLLQAVVDALKPKFNGPIFLAGATEGRVALIASVPKELTSKVQANKLIQEVAPIVGGKGGGRPEGAQGAGKDTSKIDEALARARELISL
ncbi:MAG TPA: alanine--tRNA ligase [Chthoniobacterales bacterium]|nr:alanine--tRNA ligase [Chthoniobacterales bacterium]